MIDGNKKVFDFEIHSRYSRACSAALKLPNLSAWAARKGVDIIGTGDFTHPKWFAEIKEQLQEQGNGLLKLRPEFKLRELKEKGAAEHLQRDPYFILSAEISSIYSHNGKTRRIHNLLLAPSIAVVEKIIAALTAKGAKLASDGRPITGLPSKELLRLVLEISEDCVLIPAHVWTPYFGLFGSMSGYDSVEECFEELAPHIFALETGLSADPEMFWRISQFDKYALVSCSDPHSLPRIGRECNVFELADEDLSYTNLIGILKSKSHMAQAKDFAKTPGDFLYTLEYYPEEGRYHYDGHADCKISLHPSQTAKHKGICPVCAKKLTIGVLSRTEQLSDRPEGFIRSDSVPGKHFVVLEEMIAAAFESGVASKKVQAEYLRLTNKATELSILLDLPEEDLRKITSGEISEAILKMREGKLDIEPGYDGVYGKVKLFDELKKKKPQMATLFD